jgi:hypothetical protein
MFNETSGEFDVGEADRARKIKQEDVEFGRGV